MLLYLLIWMLYFYLCCLELHLLFVLLHHTSEAYLVCHLLGSLDHFHMYHNKAQVTHPILFIMCIQPLAHGGPHPDSRSLGRGAKCCLSSEQPVSHLTLKFEILGWYKGMETGDMVPARSLLGTEWWSFGLIQQGNPQIFIHVLHHTAPYIPTLEVKVIQLAHGFLGSIICRQYTHALPLNLKPGVSMTSFSL